MDERQAMLLEMEQELEEANRQLADSLIRLITVLCGEEEKDESEEV